MTRDSPWRIRIRRVGSERRRRRSVIAASSSSAADDGVELGVGERQHREPVAARQQPAVDQLGHRAQLVDRHELQLADRRDGDPVPARVGRIGLGVVVLRGRVELGRVGLGGLHHLGDPGHAGRLGVGVVEDHLVALRHRPHEVAGLVVADTVPALALLAHQVVVPERLGFGFHQPLRHGPETVPCLLTICSDRPGPAGANS